jgi:hypothetical protein
VIRSWGHDLQQYRLVYVGCANGRWKEDPVRPWQVEWFKGLNAMGDPSWVVHPVDDPALDALCCELATEEEMAAREEE